MLSYARRVECPLREQTIYEALREKPIGLPDLEALGVPHQKKRYTFSELHNEVERLAAGMVGLGLHLGDRVGVWVQSDREGR